jgi:hypothetical protein
MNHQHTQSSCLKFRDGKYLKDESRFLKVIWISRDILFLMVDTLVRGQILNLSIFISKVADSLQMP